MTEPLVSVCLPTRNYASYLPQAIASCLNQSHKSLELIIVDDASTDDSGDCIRDFVDSRIRFIENQETLGMVENWNKSLSLARGEVVKFLFADDYLEEDCIESTVSVFEDNPDVDLVFCSARVVDADDDQLYVHQPYFGTRFLPGKSEAKRCLKMGNYIGGPSSVALRREAVERLGEFNEELRLHADQEMWLRMLTEGDAYFLARPLVSVRQHDASETRRLERMGQIQIETRKFLSTCLRNTQMLALLSEAEVDELIDRYNSLHMSDFTRLMKSRVFREGLNILATRAIDSKMGRYLRMLFLSKFRYLIAEMVNRHYRT